MILSINNSTIIFILLRIFNSEILIVQLLVNDAVTTEFNFNRTYIGESVSHNYGYILDHEI